MYSNPKGLSRGQLMVHLSITNSKITVHKESPTDQRGTTERQLPLLSNEKEGPSHNVPETETGSPIDQLVCCEVLTHNDEHQQATKESSAALALGNETQCDYQVQASDFTDMPAVDDTTAQELLSQLLGTPHSDIITRLAPVDSLQSAIIGPTDSPRNEPEEVCTENGSATPGVSKESSYCDDLEIDSSDSFVPETELDSSDSLISDSDSNIVVGTGDSGSSDNGEVVSEGQDGTTIETEQVTQNSPKKRARKGAAAKDTWKCVRNKKLRMEGKAYTGHQRDQVSGRNLPKEKGPRILGPTCTSKFCVASAHRHCQDIREEDRTSLFSDFWTKMDWGQRRTFISSLVNYLPTKSTKKANTRRGGTFTYHLCVQGQRLQVCKGMFLNTLGLREWSVRQWVLNAQKAHGIHKSSSKVRRHQKLTNSKLQKSLLVKEFLKALPKLPSHYCRKKSEKLYLQTGIKSKIQLYKMLQAYCDDNGKERVSRQVLHNEMKAENIAIHKPKKDECNVCLAYKYGNINEEQYQIHEKRKLESRREKGRDKLAAEENDDTMVIAMDLQVVLMAPLLLANATYYKTKLCCHDFTLYNLANHEVMCYFWHEAQGEVKSNNFVSCIIDYLETSVRDTVTTVVIYSDGCGYQNRNVILSNALAHYALSSGKTIIQKILEKGHTQMEVDSVHSAIENKLRKRQIFWPPEYVEVITSARKRQPYTVKEVDHSFFKDFSSIQYYTSIRPGSTAGDPQVCDIRCLKYGPDGSVQFKLHYSDDWAPLPHRRRNSNPLITPLYKGPLKIKETKWEHLQQLKEVLPKDYHSFYDNLPH